MQAVLQWKPGVASRQTDSARQCLDPVYLLEQGDPTAAPYAVENVKELVGKKPVFGICMGHQLLGQAFGGDIFKLKFGHHGGNHPIRFNATRALQVPLFHPRAFCAFNNGLACEDAASNQLPSS